MFFRFNGLEWKYNYCIYLIVELKKNIFFLYLQPICSFSWKFILEVVRLRCYLLHYLSRLKVKYKKFLQKKERVILLRKKIAGNFDVGKGQMRLWCQNYFSSTLFGNDWHFFDITFIHLQWSTLVNCIS